MSGPARESRPPTRRVLWTAGVLVAGLAAACQPVETPPDLTPTVGTLTLGTVDVPRFGDTRWVDLADDQLRRRTRGAQRSERTLDDLGL